MAFTESFNATENNNSSENKKQMENTVITEDKNQNQPLISVIIPIYNVENYLSECVDSVIKQTYKNLEIILVDDGSTDSSGKMCDTLAKEDQRIVVFHKENGGLSDARNYGIDRCQGHWITFIDSDDYVSEDYVSTLFSLNEDEKTLISACAHEIFYESGKRTYKGFTDIEKAVFTTKEALSHILLDDGLDLSAWGKLYKRELFSEIRFPKGLAFEDTATTYRLFLLSEKIAWKRAALYHYRIRSNSITTSASFKKKLELITNTKLMCDNITEKYPDLAEQSERRLVWAYFSTLNQLLKCPERKDFKKEEKEIYAFLKSKAPAIKKGKSYSKRDKLASLSLSLGLSFYNLIWKLYAKIAKS